MKYIHGKKNTCIAIGVVVILIGGALTFQYRRIFVAAMVNGHPISRLSVMRKAEKERGKNILDGFIVESLINAEARKKGITVSKDELAMEIKKIEEVVKAQGGGTLDDALKAQGVSRVDIEKQITIQKKVEKILADKINVSSEDVEKYIKDNKVTLPAGKEEETKKQIEAELRQQKLTAEATKWVSDLRANAKIRYFVQY